MPKVFAQVKACLFCLFRKETRRLASVERETESTLSTSLFILLVIAILGWWSPAQAATIFVTTIADNGAGCTLREAVTSINNASVEPGCTAQGTFGQSDEVAFEPGVSGNNISLLNGELRLERSIFINNNSIVPTTIFGTRISRIFNVTGSNVIITLERLILRSGSALGRGGAIQDLGGNNQIFIFNSTILDNDASSDGGGIAIENGNLTLVDTIISNNTSGDEAGGIDFRSTTSVVHTLELINSSITNNNSQDDGGGLFVRGRNGNVRLNITGSTVSNNRTGSLGGGIFFDQGAATISNSTISTNRSNTPPAGSGLLITNASADLNNVTVTGNIIPGNTSASVLVTGNSSVDINNSILANTTDNSNPLISGADCRIDSSSTSGQPDISADTNNIFENDECNTEALTVDPLLGPLADNGGPTLTHGLLVDSPAVNAADSETCELIDQRGEPRNDVLCDIGSFELQSAGDILIANNRWTMFGLSVDPGSNNTVEDVFEGILEPFDYGSRWVVYERDEANDRYLFLNLTSPLVQGPGYWVLQITGEDVLFNPLGDPTPVVPFLTNPNCSSFDGCFEIELTSPEMTFESRFNLVSHPFLQSTRWRDISIEIDGVIVCTLVDAALNNYIENAFFNYNGNAYDSFSSFFPPPEGGVFEAFHGYWVNLLGATAGRSVKLLVPNGPARTLFPTNCFDPQEETESTVSSLMPDETLSDDTTAELPWWLAWVSSAEAADETLKPGEWWVRLQAESEEEGGMVDQYNYLGWYRDASDGQDRRDLRELPPFGSPYLTIVFRQQDWGESSGDYTTDIRKRKHWREGEQWEFIVKSDQLGREVTLSWQGYDAHRSFWRMRLVDMESGEEVRTVRRRQLETYTFIMYDTEHRFKWIYLPRPNQ